MLLKNVLRNPELFNLKVKFLNLRLCVTGTSKEHPTYLHWDCLVNGSNCDRVTATTAGILLLQCWTSREEPGL